ncbi:MAG: hypothetical protein ACRDK3_07480 [Actinomycetota bacterium]
MLSSMSKLMLVLALVAGSLTVAAPPASTATTYVVKAKSGDKWGPKTTHAKMQGGKVVVKWKNPTARNHDVKSVNIGKRWTLKKKVLEPKNGNAVKKTLKKKGKFWFRCTIHSAKVGGEWKGMVAKIHVF